VVDLKVLKSWITSSGIRWVEREGLIAMRTSSIIAQSVFIGGLTGVVSENLARDVAAFRADFFDLCNHAHLGRAQQCNWQSILWADEEHLVPHR